MMNKKVIALLLTGMLAVPMVGCSNDTTIRVFGKEIISFSKNGDKEKDKVNIKDFLNKDKPEEKDNPDITDVEAIEALKQGIYTVTIDGTDYQLVISEALERLFPETIYAAEYMGNNIYKIDTSSNKNDDYVIFEMNCINGDIIETEIHYNDETLTGKDKAHEGFTYLLATLIQEDAEESIKCKHCGKEYKQSKSDASKPESYCSDECETEAAMLAKKKKEEDAQKKNQSKCKWCGKSYNPQDSNAWENDKFCSKSCHAAYEEKQQAKQQKTCKWCNTNKLPAGAGDNDKCSECQQENWNWHCGDCGKSMSLSEYNSTGRETGFCPSCYEKYKQATSGNNETSHKTYYCDRCGKDVTYKNFLQNVGGYDFLCEGCAMELGY